MEEVMDCEKCKSLNVEVVNEIEHFYQCPYTYEQELSKSLVFKCLDCGYEFEIGDFYLEI